MTAPTLLWKPKRRNWVVANVPMFVPVFKGITGLPPFVGIMLVLSVLWIATELFYRNLATSYETHGTKKRVVNLLHRIDMSTILFFLGILMAVASLEQTGVLTSIGKGLNVAFEGNHYAVSMYPVAPTGDMAVDGIFWQLLAYCAGVGGSMLIIGSAAGVVVMGLEKITFGWYMKHVSWIAALGYLGGIFCYWIMRTFIMVTPA